MHNQNPACTNARTTGVRTGTLSGDLAGRQNRAIRKGPEIDQHQKQRHFSEETDGPVQEVPDSPAPPPPRPPCRGQNRRRQHDRCPDAKQESGS